MKNKKNKGKESFLCFVSPPLPKSSSTVGVGSRRTGRDDDDDDDTPITARKTRNIWILVYVYAGIILYRFLLMFMQEDFFFNHALRNHGTEHGKSLRRKYKPITQPPPQCPLCRMMASTVGGARSDVHRARKKLPMAVTEVRPEVSREARDVHTRGRINQWP